VVKVDSASSSQNTRSEQLERSLISLDGDGDGLLSKGRHHSRVRRGGNVSERGRGRVSNLGALGLGAGASSLGGAGDIRVFRLGADTAVLLGPVESIVHEASVAAVIASAVGEGVAINEVLLRERGESAVLHLDGAFHGTSGGERPARAALALVLDSSDGAGRDPVDGGGDTSHGSGGTVDSGGVEGGLGVKASSEESRPLSTAHVGELVVAELVGEVLGIGLLDQIVVGGEVSEHGYEVLARGGLDVVGGHPVKELGLIKRAVTEVGGRGRGNDSGSE